MGRFRKLKQKLCLKRPLKFELAKYKNAADVVWCQEEPQNQGAWYSSQHHFWAAVPAGAQLTYAGREASAAPACGYPELHTHQQESLVNSALKLTITL